LPRVAIDRRHLLRGNDGVFGRRSGSHQPFSRKVMRLRGGPAGVVFRAAAIG
jgi:hypothetical protein